MPATKELAAETWEETKAKCGCDRCTGKAEKIETIDYTDRPKITALLDEADSCLNFSFSSEALAISNIVKVLRMMNNL